VLRCHAAAFEALGGAPREILYDRMKTAVLGERNHDGIIYNRALIERKWGSVGSSTSDRRPTLGRPRHSPSGRPAHQQAVADGQPTGAGAADAS
jgi:hypothetical protein